jgi:TRAP-type mannitol/chloroaromatic compound transport system permease small subunit
LSLLVVTVTPVVTLATTWLVLIVVPVSATAVVGAAILLQSSPAYPAVALADVTTVTLAGMQPAFDATNTTAV